MTIRQVVNCPGCRIEVLYKGEDKLKCHNPQCAVLTFTVHDK